MFLTSAEVCERLRIDPKTLRKWIKSGELPALKAGPGLNAGWRIDEQDFADFLERQQAKAASA